MTKQKKTKRIFYVLLNTDDMSIHMDRLLVPQSKADFLDGMYKGARNVPLDQEEFQGLPVAFQRGYGFGKVAYDEAAEAWNKSQAAGRKSAEARAAKNGTAQPSGGKGTKRADGYQHPKWQELRLRVMERDGFACRKCGSKDKQLHVHHLKYTVGAEVWESPLEDLLTACCDCHGDAHK